ncbi:carbon-nitrogen hydrolase family protein [Ramlibacter ginsenosidimutans]|uniref:Carbon-nitrogen hydrolase family protein n=1 Tax=Ramlibacter ginsenosidimutans TaxID=502333 RepID=A0A934TSL9_9BURK|nr:carbon-nitrogen hydrolase family protein [Ramlibacter ginsenosidimutans]MBK6006598.1 carbon-nitrogen hydrolase family protein [Ramlibacter ginsenosidimutans]
MPRVLTVAAAQTGSVEDGDLRTIADAAHCMLDEAARQQVRLLTFCELFLTPFFANRLEEDFDRYFLRENDDVLRGLRDKARQHGIALVLPFAERAADGYFNSAFVYDTDGREVGRYRKTHIPAYFPNPGPGGTGSFEKFYFAPGARLETYPVAGTRIGIQICNDRLYPEASRALALHGAEMIVMPISFSTYADPAQRASIWEIPLRARAYENGVWVVACNRVGTEGARHHLGRSMVVDPRGMITAEAGTGATQLLTTEVDLDAVSAARKKFPWWRDRRPDLYGPLVDAA